MKAALAAIALVAAVATAVLAARGGAIEAVVAAAFVASLAGAGAAVLALAVEVAPGTIVVLVGGRHRGKDRRWRGWRFVTYGRTLKLPGEEVVRVPVDPAERDDVIAAIDAALFRHRPRGRAEPVIRAAIR